MRSKFSPYFAITILLVALFASISLVEASANSYGNLPVEPTPSAKNTKQEGNQPRILVETSMMPTDKR